MSEQSRFASDLWRRLAEAQDVYQEQTLSAAQPLDEVGRKVARLVESNSPSGFRGMGRRPHVWRRGFAGLVVLGATGMAAMVLVQRPTNHLPAGEAPAFTHDRTRGRSANAADADGQPVVADARSDLPMRFSDGSQVVFRAGSAGRVQRLTGSGADIAVERGRLDVHVIHADKTLWLFHAGPYRVRVTGTRFAMRWTPPQFEVDLLDGAVVVDGAVLGAGVPLRAGQRLKVAGTTVVVEPLAPVPASQRGISAAGDLSAAPLSSAPTGQIAEGGPSLAPRIEAASSGDLPHASSVGPQQPSERWLLLAEQGAYRQALASANHVGWKALCHRSDARRLLTLGDVARYSGARTKARQAFQSLVTRFPNDRLAADALFSLGRMAFEAQRPAEATRWFRRYVAEWPDAPLGDQAAGRLLECAIRLDDRDAARAAAESYLARAPMGPHASLAREVLEQPVDEGP